MKISLNWLKEYIDIPITPDELSVVLTDLGLEVEGLEEIESVKGGLKGIVVGHVTECGKHPGADKLSLTKVDVGKEELLQIVCGAPNVAVGQKVLVATIGTTLYGEDGKPWNIKKGKIRGEFSEGMICAEDEVGLGKGHDGILVLPNELQPGLAAAEHFQIKNDYVYDIGLTPNRSDATSHIGVARDLAAYFKIYNIGNGELKLPDLNNFESTNNDLQIAVEVKDTTLCPRYSGVSLKNVKIQTSPDWLRKNLEAIGVRPISNIVDITNYVLHEYGQPLHAFDLDKISDKKVIVQTLADKTAFKSLDEQDRKLSAEDLMICDGSNKGMCIAGVFGGMDSSVTDSTQNIFLEAAHFNAKSIRRTSTRHNLRTDAAICFEKGSDPNITIDALKRAALLIQTYGGGEVASKLVDVYPVKIEPCAVTVKYAKVSSLIGVDIPKEKIHNILAALKMEIASSDDFTFTVLVPTDKADVTREADVIEEILRIYGFNNIPIPSTLKSNIVHTAYPDQNQIKNLLAEILTAKGFNEMMNLSIGQSEKYMQVLPKYEQSLVYINNTSNINLDIMRPEMLLSALDTTLYNQNRQQHDLKLYEFGRSFQKLEDASIQEVEHLSILLNGKEESQSWISGPVEPVKFHNLKQTVVELLVRLGFSKYQVDEVDDYRFEYGLYYHQGPRSIVTFGEVNKAILSKMGIKGPVFFAVFDVKTLCSAQKKHKVTIQAPSKYPMVRRDLALVVEDSLKFEEIVRVTNKVEKNLLTEVKLFDVYKNNEQLGADKKSYAVSFTFENQEKTLKDKEVDKIMNKLIFEFEKQLNALIRK